jgi:hypothetical protein
MGALGFGNAWPVVAHQQRAGWRNVQFDPRAGRRMLERVFDQIADRLGEGRPEAADPDRLLRSRASADRSARASGGTASWSASARRSICDTSRDMRSTSSRSAAMSSSWRMASICARITASGVFSSCAASAVNARCAASVRSSRSRPRLTVSISGRISRGTNRSGRRTPELWGPIASAAAATCSIGRSSARIDNSDTATSSPTPGISSQPTRAKNWSTSASSRKPGVVSSSATTTVPPPATPRSASSTAREDRPSGSVTSALRASRGRGGV